MFDGLTMLCTSIAVSVGIARYLVGAALRITHPEVGVRKDFSYKPTLSILLPCFQEGPAVYSTIESIFACDYPADKLEVIATDDASDDDSWEWIQKAAARYPKLVAMRNEHNCGKTKTILNALERSSAELVMIVDSDTLLATDCLSHLAACMADDRLGAVGAPATVRNPNDNALTTFQQYIYVLGFQLGKTIENLSRTVGVLGGYAFMARRVVFEGLRKELESRHWFGCKVLDGEDRFCSHLILLSGRGTYMDMAAVCYTAVPNTFRKYYLQQIRWRRTTIRDFFFTLRYIPKNAANINVFSLYVYVLTPVVLLIGMAQMMILFLTNPTEWIDLNRLAIFVIYTLVTLMLVKPFMPGQQVKNPLKVLVYSGWWILNNLFLVPAAMFSLDQGSWETRVKKEKA
jgi:hyaluronan synthase